MALSEVSEIVQKELDLIKNSLKTIYNKDINFNLLFKASKDVETFIVFISIVIDEICKSIKGYTFESYTEETFDSSSESVKVDKINFYLV